MQALPQVLALLKKVKKLLRVLQVSWTWGLMLKKEKGPEVLDIGISCQGETGEGGTP